MCVCDSWLYGKCTEKGVYVVKKKNKTKNSVVWQVPAKLNELHKLIIVIFHTLEIKINTKSCFSFFLNIKKILWEEI